jgi:hypothetical protein
MSALLPARAMIACGPLGGTAGASDAGAALARGLSASGRPAADVFAIEHPGVRGSEARRLLEAEHFDQRMLAARALVLLLDVLAAARLAGSLMLELATRARQSGVPCYAVTAENRLGLFDLRVLDIQCVLIAGDAESLERAGRSLDAII